MRVGSRLETRLSSPALLSRHVPTVPRRRQRSKCTLSCAVLKHSAVQLMVSHPAGMPFHAYCNANRGASARGALAQQWATLDANERVRPGP
jgi:hypothetical protein